MRVTEIMYHPPNATEQVPFGDQEFEFLELRNTGPSDIDLRDARLRGDIEFDFSASAIGVLSPGEFVVVVANREAFASRYPAVGNVAGEYVGRLSNSRGTLRVIGRFDAVIQEFAFDDAWYPSTDGGGHSLVIADESAPMGLWDERVGWSASLSIHGSPGTGEGYRFVRGDCNQDLSVNLTDGIFLLNFLFLGGTVPGCLAACDTNGGGVLDVTTAVFVFNFLFLGGPPLPAPRECGVSEFASDAELGCLAPRDCP